MQPRLRVPTSKNRRPFSGRGTTRSFRLHRTSAAWQGWSANWSSRRRSPPETASALGRAAGARTFESCASMRRPRRVPRRTSAVRRHRMDPRRAAPRHCPPASSPSRASSRDRRTWPCSCAPRRGARNRGRTQRSSSGWREVRGGVRPKPRSNGARRSCHVARIRSCRSRRARCSRTRCGRACGLAPSSSPRNCRRPEGRRERHVLLRVADHDLDRLFDLRISNPSALKEITQHKHLVEHRDPASRDLAVAVIWHRRDHEAVDPLKRLITHLLQPIEVLTQAHVLRRRLEPCPVL